VATLSESMAFEWPAETRPMGHMLIKLDRRGRMIDG
jgi:hypothetical protein